MPEQPVEREGTRALSSSSPGVARRRAGGQHERRWNLDRPAGGHHWAAQWTHRAAW